MSDAVFLLNVQKYSIALTQHTVQGHGISMRVSLQFEDKLVYMKRLRDVTTHRHNLGCECTLQT